MRERRLFAAFYGANQPEDKRGKLGIIGMKRDLRKAIVDGTLKDDDQVGEFVFKYTLKVRTELAMIPVAVPSSTKRRKQAMAQALGEEPVKPTTPGTA